MWGMAGWTGGGMASRSSLDRAIELGCEFLRYGRATATASACSGDADHPGETARRDPPGIASGRRVGQLMTSTLRTTSASTEEPRKPRRDTLDLSSCTWNDRWASDERWQKALASLKEQKLVRALGISVNRFQPSTCSGRSKPG